MIEDYLKHTVRKRGEVTYDELGKPTSTYGEPIPCRFHARRDRLTNERGEVYFTDARLYLLPDVDVKLGDIFQNGDMLFKVASVDDKSDLDGVDAFKLCLLVRTEHGAES